MDILVKWIIVVDVSSGESMITCYFIVLLLKTFGLVSLRYLGLNGWNLKRWLLCTSVGKEFSDFGQQRNSTIWILALFVLCGQFGERNNHIFYGIWVVYYWAEILISTDFIGVILYIVICVCCYCSLLFISSILHYLVLGCEGYFVPLVHLF